MWVESAIKDCPSCKQEQTLKCSASLDFKKLFWICSKCKFIGEEPLPQPQKKIIYLDQCFVSNARKAKDNYEKMTDEDKRFYLEAWQKLCELFSLQLIVCPYSYFHETESLADNNTLSIQNNYEYLSGGVRFKDPYSIYNDSIIHAWINYLNGKNNQHILPLEQITLGEVNEWTSTLQISLLPNQNSLTLEIKNSRRTDASNLHKGLIEYLTDCKNKHKDFKSKHKEILELAIKDYQNDELLKLRFKRALAIDIQEPNLSELINDFFAKNIEEIIYLNLYASIIASIAHIYNPESIDRGTCSDIQMLSTLIPHCDAMVIDKQMYNILNFGPAQTPVHLNCRRFTMQLEKRHEFLTYLDEIKSTAPDSYKKIAIALYKKPENSIFDKLSMIAAESRAQSNSQRRRIGVPSKNFLNP